MTVRNILTILTVTAFAGIAGLYVLEEFCNAKCQQKKDEDMPPTQMEPVEGGDVERDGETDATTLFEYNDVEE